MVWKKRAVGVLALAILILAGGASGGPAAEAGDEPAVRDVTARLLRTLTAEQLDDYLAGTSPSAVVLAMACPGAVPFLKSVGTSGGPLTERRTTGGPA